jgi:hypothetical protein
VAQRLEALHRVLLRAAIAKKKGAVGGLTNKNGDFI